MRTLSCRLFRRRDFIKGALASMALPPLESLAESSKSSKVGKKAKNIVFIGTYLGFYQKAFFPKEIGSGYDLSPLLKPIAGHRENFTVFSGLDHRAGNGHQNWHNFLCGVSPGAYSIDQMIADEIGQSSRFASIHLCAGTTRYPMSFTKEKVRLPMIQRPSVLYKKLFPSKDNRERTDYLLSSGKSALDNVLEDAKRLEMKVSQRDRKKLSEYFYALRSFEKSMTRRQALIDKPIPKVDYKKPDYDPIAPSLQLEAETMIYELMALALEIEASRVFTFFIGGLGQVFTINGKTLKSGYHGLSHHGNNPVSIEQLIMIEIEHMKKVNYFLNLLKEKKNIDGTSLLDETIVVLGSGMGDASRHANDNLPTLVAGGGFKHGQHIAVDPSKEKDLLLGDLYITLMQKLGMEKKEFSNANRNMNHLFT